MNVKVKKHRSPSYPAISLGAAVKLAEKLYPVARHALGAEVIAQQLGYKGLNSCTSQIAAMKQFGLLKEEKGGADRMLRLTDWGMDIGVDPDGQSKERRSAIEHAALNPTLYAELWDKWQATPPPDGDIRRYLERERGFNPKHVPACIADYKSTLDFAGLTGDGTIEEEEPEVEPRRGQPPAPKKVAPEQKAPLMVQTPASLPAESGPFISFPLPAGNAIEIRLHSKVSKNDFARIKALIDLSEESLVEDARVSMILGPRANPG
jgi:hypothetical protein